MSKELEYKCPWPNCKHELTQKVGSVYKNRIRQHHKKPSKHVSSSVICPQCKNWLKTWDGKEKLVLPPLPKN